MNAPVKPHEFAGSPHYLAFTSREYQQMVMADAFGDSRVELVRGELRKMMPSNWKHGELNATVGALLRAAYSRIGAGVGFDVMIEIDEQTTLAADVVVVRPGFEGDGALRAKDIVMVAEIANTTQARDMGEKSVDYARAGIADYWVFDAKRRSTRIFSGPGEAGYTSWRDVPFEEDVTPPGATDSVKIGNG